MKTNTRSVCFVGFLLAVVGVVVPDWQRSEADDPKAQADLVRKELEDLQGTWTVVSVKAPEGEEGLDELKKRNYRLTFKGNRLTIKTEDDVTEAIITLDPSKQPKTIDIVTQREEKIKETKYLGIYKLDEHTLTLCHNIDYFPRPTAFEYTNKQANRSATGLMVLKREVRGKK
jgi:uncharacterized protein (TIGR03067 family)